MLHLACDQDSLKAGLLKELGMCPLQILHKMLLCLSVRTSQRNLSSSHTVSILLIQTLFWLCFSRKMGPGLPVGVRAADPSLATSQFVSDDFIQPHSVEQQGVTRVDVALPTSIPSRLKAHREAQIKGAGCFWFILLSHYIFNSQIRLLKSGFVFLFWSRQGAIEL